MNYANMHTVFTKDSYGTNCKLFYEAYSNYYVYMYVCTVFESSFLKVTSYLFALKIFITATITVKLILRTLI